MENKELLDELKKRIAISNFKAEYEQKNEKVFPKNILEEGRKYMINKRKLLQVVSVLAVVVIFVGIGTGIKAKNHWDIGFKEYEANERSLGFSTIKAATEAGYTENLDMDYVVQDGIGVKLSSLLMTDEYVEIIVDFKFPEDMEINTETFCFSFGVCDEEKNVYAVETRLNGYSPAWSSESPVEHIKDMYQRWGIEFDRTNIFGDHFISGGTGGLPISAKDHTITSKMTFTPFDVYPKSKKLYVVIKDLGFTMVDFSGEENYTEDFDISDAEWSFEIDVPKKFYERTMTKLDVAEEIPNLSLDKVEVSEIYLVVKGSLEGFFETVYEGEIPLKWTEVWEKSIYITDENGEIYYCNNSDNYTGKDGFRYFFEITKDMLNKKFFLNVVQDGKLYTSELVQK